ncbi:cysteine hydrolase [Agrobacterium tumefaciens]|jgi:nicotinamidase-related amidase|uniref:cysteine hydrolase family protein n=1 Tax=Agrobacterium TaxID=357 RepID=UPI000FDD8C57|nr:cysteine hydrolase [Agrobacterium sp. RS6]NSZ77116.1 cysteine hydrolase [Agrobacterium tumefaciens]NTA13550.1 cysteine hydrolase [Agrobacterium tumefaciens]NTA62096.1 cysteine hydrolase [Agrobacterium tumefaciens]NTZ63751.1 cysteine hydrolase [Agrobacterium tumefaciens]UXR94992.1 cysteine hydrolase [Agrobacterium tumefaciens]
MISHERTFLQWCHLCIDMQRMFAEETPWHVDWMPRIIDNVGCVVENSPERTVFTRFIPPPDVDAAAGRWGRYYEKWWMMTGEHLRPEMTEIVSEFAGYVPPAQEFLKTTYSPWTDGRLHRTLAGQGVGTLVISGGETDVCVLATVLGAVDLGYRIFLLEDALCSARDTTHDASLTVLRGRFASQLRLVFTLDWLDRREELLLSV